MKNKITFLYLFVIATLFGAFYSDSAKANLLTNPSFESGTTEWNIWENTSVVTGQAQAGNYAMLKGRMSI